MDDVGRCSVLDPGLDGGFDLVNPLSRGGANALCDDEVDDCSLDEPLEASFGLTFRYFLAVGESGSTNL